MQSSNIDTFIGNVATQIINPIIYLLFAVALVYFLFGVFQFIANAEDEEARTTGRNHMIWGIIGFVIMLGVFGIMNIILNTFNIKGINPEQGTVHLQ